MTAVLNPFRNVASAVSPRATDYRSQAQLEFDDLAAEVDSHGSPVSVPAAEWFVCFVPGLQKQWWHRFAHKRHQHVFAIRMVEDGSWLLVESWWTRMLVTVLTLDEALKFLRWGASGDILQVREAIPGRGNQLRGWSNCAVLMAFMLGRAYRTWTPHGLYCRLLAEQGVRTIDLKQWLANHVGVIAARDVDEALEALEPEAGHTLRSVLLSLGSGIMRGLTSRSALAIYRASISESGRFEAVSSAYLNCGLPQRAVEAVRKALQQAQMRGDIAIEDVGVAATQFIAMLRGDIHLEILFGLRSRPNATEISARVKSVVDLFLNGAALADLSASGRIGRQRCLDASQIDNPHRSEVCLEEPSTLDYRMRA